MRPQIKATWIVFVLAIGSLTLMAAGNGPFDVHLPLALRNSAAPTATATSPAPAVVVLPNSSWYQAGSSTVRVIGEVQNNGSQTVTAVLVTVNLINASGQVVKTEAVYTFLKYLPPGERTCFNLQLIDPAAWTRYEFETPTYVATSSTGPVLATTDVNASINQFGWYKITGRVRNDDSVRVTGAEVIATLHSATGAALDCDAALANPSSLDPGQSGPFENTFTRRDDYADVASYRLQTDGNRP